MKGELPSSLTLIELQRPTTTAPALTGLGRLRSACSFAKGRAKGNRGSATVEVRWLPGLLLVVGSIVWGMRADATEIATGGNALEQRGLGFLKSLPREWSGTSDRDCKTYEDKNIDRLTRSFAASAGAFLSAFRQVHGAVTITSAHRTVAEQTCVCIGEKGPCAGRPRLVKRKKGKSVVVRSMSHHQLGIALDVRPGTGSEDEFICLQEFAQLNPQFGVRFPFGKRDYPHMEPGLRPGAIKLAALAPPRTSVTPCSKMKIMLTDAPVD